jgi:hypothetical protein
MSRKIRLIQFAILAALLGACASRIANDRNMGSMTGTQIEQELGRALAGETAASNKE